MPEGGIVACVDVAHISNIAAVANGDIVDEVTDVLDEAAVANGDIAQGSVIESAQFDELVAHLNGALGATNLDGSVECYAVAVRRIEAVGHGNLLPILCQTAIIGQYFNLFSCEVSICSHILVTM